VKKAKTKKRVAKAKPKKAPRRATGSRWLAFVKKHGVVFASARGPIPNVAEAVAGEPIVGSWWAHPKGKQIFQVLSQLDDSADIRCFRLVDGKITLAHRRVWPALVRLGKEGALPADRLASLQQEHMPSGEHRNFVTPFPEWVDAETAKVAERLSKEQALKALPFSAAGGAASRSRSSRAAGPRRATS
jgi:hypothetical protein